MRLVKRLESDFEMGIIGRGLLLGRRVYEFFRPKENYQPTCSENMPNALPREMGDYACPIPTGNSERYHK